MSTGNPYGQNGSTFVKSFFAETIQIAMQRARMELGADALLINSREAPPEARHLGQYEIVFGICAEPPAGPPDRVESLRLRVEKIRASIRRNRSAGVAQALINAGVEPALARQIEAAAHQRVARLSVPRVGQPRPAPGSDAQILLREAAAEIGDHFEADPEIGRVTALIGPAGCGKTTTLVKLAIQQGVARGRAVHLISMDTQKIGGAEQLRAYATILGASFQVAENAAALAQAIESAPSPALLLIDTPGYNAATLHESGSDLAAFLNRRHDIDTHLLLTASMRIEDLHKTARLYDVFRPAKLLFTRLDETTSLAAVFCIAARRNNPVSFFSAGPSIPEDLEPASKDKIVASLVRQLPSVMELAA